MELTLNTKDCGGRGHVPDYGLLSDTDPNTQTTTQITTSKKITRPCFIPSAGENFINAAEYLYGKEYLCQCVSKFKLHGLTQRPNSQLHKVIYDKTIQSSITYNDACVFTFENVVIDNSSIVNVVVEPLSGETTIVRSFEVKQGSTFEVK